MSNESDSATQSKTNQVSIMQEKESSIGSSIQVETTHATEPTQTTQPPLPPTRKAAQKKSKKLKNILPLTSTPIRRKNLQHSTFKLAKKLYGGDLEKALDFWEDEEEKSQRTEVNDDQNLPNSLFVDLFFDEGKKSRKTIEKEGILSLNIILCSFY